MHQCVSGLLVRKLAWIFPEAERILHRKNVFKKKPCPVGLEDTGTFIPSSLELIPPACVWKNPPTAAASHWVCLVAGQRVSSLRGHFSSCWHPNLLSCLLISPAWSLLSSHTQHMQQAEHMCTEATVRDRHEEEDEISCDGHLQGSFRRACWLVACWHPRALLIPLFGLFPTLFFPCLLWCLPAVVSVTSKQPASSCFAPLVPVLL